nr:hypothetical protein [Tanacetum cinerariifolium]
MAAFIPDVNIVKVLFIGLGIVKDEATVKEQIWRLRDFILIFDMFVGQPTNLTKIDNVFCIRELIKGPVNCAITLTLCVAIYWRTSPIAITAIFNLCAGDDVKIEASEAANLCTTLKMHNVLFTLWAAEMKRYTKAFTDT